MKKIIATFVLFLTLQVPAYAADQGHEGHDHPANDGKITTPELLTEVLEGDVVYGQPDAPVTIVEYASLSCSHCATFYTDVFNDLRNNYIAKGKVKLVYRHYPLNKPALQATLLVECAADNAIKQELLGKLFTTQKQWAFARDFTSELRSIADISGIKAESFNACIADTKKQDALLALQIKAQKGLSVSSTPTLFINGERFDNARSYSKLSKHIDGLLQSVSGGKDAQ